MTIFRYSGKPIERLDNTIDVFFVVQTAYLIITNWLYKCLATSCGAAELKKEPGVIKQARRPAQIIVARLISCQCLLATGFTLFVHRFLN